MVPGDEGYSDEDRLHGALERYLTRLGNFTSEAPISELFPEHEGFRITGLGQRTTASRARDRTAIVPIGSFLLRYTVGVPMDGLHGLLRYARDKSSTSGALPPFAAVDAGLVVGDVVAAWWAAEAGAPGSANVPTIVAHLTSDRNYHELRGYAALIFTQAIAPTLRYSWVADGHAYGSFKGNLAVASRRPPHVLREALSPEARAFLDRNADVIKALFQQQARELMTPGLTGDPLEFPFATDRIRARDYLDNALLDPSPDRKQVTPKDAFGIQTIFPELDSGLTGEEQRPPRTPLVLIELRWSPEPAGVRDVRPMFRDLKRNVQRIIAEPQGRHANLHGLSSWRSEAARELARTGPDEASYARAVRLKDFRQHLARLGTTLHGYIRDYPAARDVLPPAVSSWIAVMRATQQLLDPSPPVASPSAQGERPGRRSGRETAYIAGIIGALEASIVGAPTPDTVTPPGAWWGQAAEGTGERPPRQGAPGDAVNRENLVSEVLSRLEKDLALPLPLRPEGDQLKAEILNAYDELIKVGRGSAMGRGTVARANYLAQYLAGRGRPPGLPGGAQAGMYPRPGAVDASTTQTVAGPAAGGSRDPAPESAPGSPPAGLGMPLAGLGQGVAGEGAAVRDPEPRIGEPQRLRAELGRMPASESPARALGAGQVAAEGVGRLDVAPVGVADRGLAQWRARALLGPGYGLVPGEAVRVMSVADRVGVGFGPGDARLFAGLAAAVGLRHQDPWPERSLRRGSGTRERLFGLLGSRARYTRASAWTWPTWLTCGGWLTRSGLTVPVAGSRGSRWPTWRVSSGALTRATWPGSR